MISIDQSFSSSISCNKYLTKRKSGQCCNVVLSLKVKLYKLEIMSGNSQLFLYTEILLE